MRNSLTDYNLLRFHLFQWLSWFFENFWVKIIRQILTFWLLLPIVNRRGGLAQWSTVLEDSGPLSLDRFWAEMPCNLLL